MEERCRQDSRWSRVLLHVVRLGDTMWVISAQLGSTVHRLAAANGIANPDVISVGQRIHY